MNYPQAPMCNYTTPYSTPYNTPYSAPYAPMYQQQVPASQPQQAAQDYAAMGVKWVDGIDEVRSCVTPVGRFLFMDRNKMSFYVRDANANGIATVTEYQFSEASEAVDRNAQYVTAQQLQDAIKDLEARYESIVRPTVPTNAEPTRIPTATAQVAEPAIQPTATAPGFATNRADAIR